MQEKTRDEIKSACQNYTDDPKQGAKGAAETAFGSFLVLLGGTFIARGLRRLFGKHSAT